MKKMEIHLKHSPFTLRGLVYLIDVFARRYLGAEPFNEPRVGERQQGGRTTRWGGDSFKHLRPSNTLSMSSLLASGRYYFALKTARHLT
jgi:hypothetical protein